MNSELVERLIHAVLYEGYILYPYRASARKNRHRFTFGRVYPELYAADQKGAEPCVMQAECLAAGSPEKVRVEVEIRFLHPLAREVGPATSPEEFRAVPELEVDGELYQTWQEAVERTVHVPPIGRDCPPARQPFAFPASRSFEALRDANQQAAGLLCRRQEAVEGEVDVRTEPIDAEVFRLTVRVLNRTPVPPDLLDNQEAVLMRTLASTHAVLRIDEGAFLSLTDPPAGYAAAAAQCHNIGVWPVLIGDERLAERDAMIASPIIMSDYPQVAPESPGDLFDAAEIDEILSLRILALSDAEKREMCRVDEQARRILERTEGLTHGQFLKMHGTLREAPGEDSEFFRATAPIEEVTAAGVTLGRGSRVRIRPRARADVMDIALAGRVAVIEAIERDAEDRIHVALVLDDDPGKDLGLLRQPGHRFFFGIDEIEPLP